MKRIQYIVTIDFANDDEGAAAEVELLDAVAVLPALFMVRAEANYDRTVEINDNRSNRGRWEMQNGYGSYSEPV